MRKQGIDIVDGGYEEFRMGSIVSNESEVPIETETTYFIFKVVIGRAYVRRRSRMDPTNKNNNLQPPDGYDSIYI